MRIKTKSFNLAAYAKGNPDSSRMALVLPGRLDTKDYSDMRSLVDALAEKGFYALSFDPPGTWDSEGSLDIYTTTNYLKAVSEVIDNYGGKPTLLLGFSRGGSVAILHSNSPQVIGLIAIMANYGAPTDPDTEAIRLGYQLTVKDKPYPQLGEVHFKLPLNYFKDGQKYDIKTALKMCEKPKLLIYGTDDEFTKPQEVLELYAKTPEPKALEVVESVHYYRKRPEIVTEVNQIVGEFVDKYFPA